MGACANEPGEAHAGSDQDIRALGGQLLAASLSVIPAVSMQAGDERSGPLLELEFWAARAGDLRGLAAQLSGERAVRIADALRAAGSTYEQPLHRHAAFLTSFLPGGDCKTKTLQTRATAGRCNGPQQFCFHQI